MFERFTDRARKIMALADQEARRVGHEFIGTEHILLGLVKEGSGVGATVLKNLDVDLVRVREEVERLVHRGTYTTGTGRLSPTPQAKAAIAYAIEEARSLNHNYVGSEHLLLGLIREREGIAGQVLVNLGLDLDQLRDGVIALLGTGVDPAERRNDTGGAPYLSTADESPIGKLLAAAVDEAKRLHHLRTGPEHILLAMARDGSSRTGTMLALAGLTPERIERLLKE